MNLKNLVNKRSKNLKDYDSLETTEQNDISSYNNIISSIGKELIGLDKKTNTIKGLTQEVKFSSFNSDLDDVSEGSTNKHFTSTNQTKLDGVEEGATVGATSAQVNQINSNASDISNLEGSIDSIKSTDFDFGISVSNQWVQVAKLTNSTSRSTNCSGRISVQFYSREEGLTFDVNATKTNSNISIVGYAEEDYSKYISNIRLYRNSSDNTTNVYVYIYLTPVSSPDMYVSVVSFGYQDLIAEIDDSGLIAGYDYIEETVNRDKIIDATPTDIMRLDEGVIKDKDGTLTPIETSQVTGLSNKISNLNSSGELDFDNVIGTNKPSNNADVTPDDIMRLNGVGNIVNKSDTLTPLSANNIPSITASKISDFDTEVSNNIDVENNVSKLSGIDEGADVTPSNALKIDTGILYTVDGTPNPLDFSNNSQIINKNSSELTDDAELGNTANWSQINDDDSNKPEDKADVTSDHANDIIHIGSSSPVTPKAGWIWIDSSNSDYYIVKRYNGIAWVDSATKGAKLGDNILDESNIVLVDSDIKNSEITTSNLSGKVDDTSISGTLSQSTINNLSTDLSSKVETSVTINSKPLTSNISLDADDISDLSTTNKFATASELSQISSNQSNISTNTADIETIDSYTQDNIVNLIENPFLKEASNIGWTNANDGTHNNIVSSFVPYTSEITGRDCDITSGTVTLSSAATEFSDLFSDTDITLDDGVYIKFSGDPTSALEGRIFLITSYNSTIKELYFSTSESLTINAFEKFYVGFFSNMSTQCIKLEGAQYDGSGGPDLSKSPYSNPIPFQNKFSDNLSFQCDAFCIDTVHDNARLYIYYFLEDNSGNLISSFSSIVDTGMYGASNLKWVRLQDTFNITGLINIPDDEIVYLHICLWNSLGNGQCYATGFQLNYGNAIYTEPKDSAISSTNYTNYLNTAFGNANAVSNIQNGKKPDGKYPSPANYYSVPVKYDYRTGPSENFFEVRASDLEALFPSSLDLDTNDKIVDILYNVKKYNSGDIYDSVDHYKDVQIEYDSSETVYTEEYFERLTVGDCLSSTIYRVTVSCYIQTLTPV